MKLRKSNDLRLLPAISLHQDTELLEVHMHAQLYTTSTWLVLTLWYRHRLHTYTSPYQPVAIMLLQIYTILLQYRHGD